MKSLSPAIVALSLISPRAIAFAPTESHRRRTCVETSLSFEKIPFLRRFARGKKKTTVEPPRLDVGTRLPNVDVQMLIATPDGKMHVVMTDMRDAMGDRGMSILVGMPSSSTKSCDAIHIPGYNKAAPQLKSLGIRKIAVLASSDKFISQEWTSPKQVFTTDDGTPNRIPLNPAAGVPVIMLADVDGTLVSNLGVTRDMGFGKRSNRFVLVLENGVVTQVLKEKQVKDCTATSASRVVDFLTPEPVPLVDPEAIEIDFRIVIAVGAILTIVAWEVVLSLLSDRGFTLDGFLHPNKKDPAVQVFQLLNDHLK